MVLYSLSPGAYDGLLKLADDPRWCSDYDRILRYLDVAVSHREATFLGKGMETVPQKSVSWKQVVFLEAAEYVSIRRR